MVNCVHREEGSRERVLRRAQRVRARREQSRRACCMQRIMATAYRGTTTARRTIGARADIESVPIERLQAFYRKYYQPDNAVLVVAGKFDEHEDARTSFSEVLRRDPEVRRARCSNDVHRRAGAGRRARGDAARASATCRSSGAMYHVPAGAHPDFAAVNMLRRRCSAMQPRAASTRRSWRRRSGERFGQRIRLGSGREPSILFGAEVRQEQSLDRRRARTLLGRRSKACRDVRRRPRKSSERRPSSSKHRAAA